MAMPKSADWRGAISTWVKLIFVFVGAIPDPQATNGVWTSSGVPSPFN